MARVQLAGVAKTFGDTAVLRGIDLDVADGEFVVFVGPSGCGKSTLLRIVAGLEEAGAGEIRIGDRRVNDLGPAERGIAMVFQSYALYPHLTVYENMAFGLRLSKAARAEIDSRVRRAAEILSITHLLDRKPKALSGGQRQRVAIGRAIVREPEVFLFDEPLSNLDAALRVRMRYEFSDLHRRLGATMIYVTHDQVEAMTLADRIVVLSGGRVEQIGSPLTLYSEPANLFVAGFIGSPSMNFFKGEVEQAPSGALVVRLPSGERVRTTAPAGALAAGAPVTVGVRPEHFRPDAPDNAIRLRIKFVESLGSVTYAYGQAAGAQSEVVAQFPPDMSLAAEQEVELRFSAAQAHVFGPDDVALPRRSEAPFPAKA